MLSEYQKALARWMRLRQRKGESELFDLGVDRVDMVARPANQRGFAILKENGEDMARFDRYGNEGNTIGPGGDTHSYQYPELKRLMDQLHNAEQREDWPSVQRAQDTIRRWLEANLLQTGSVSDGTLNPQAGRGVNAAQVSANDGAAYWNKKSLERVNEAFVAVHKNVATGGSEAEAIAKGVSFDGACSKSLMDSAAMLSQGSGLSMSDALIRVADLCPDLVDAHARSVSHRSEQYWKRTREVEA